MSAPANLAARLIEHARAHPDRRALIWGSGAARRAWTFAEIDAVAARAAARLSAKGVGPGDRVLVLQPMAAELYAALIGVLRLGAVAVFPDPQSLRATILRAIELLAPKAVIGPLAAQLLRAATPALWPASAFQTTGALRLAPRLIGDEGEAADLAEIAPDAPALATFTSGSTGKPKALVRAHSLLRAQQDAVAAGLGLQPGQIWLSTLPVFPLSLIAAGATAVLPAIDVRRPAEIDAEGLIEQIAAEGVEGLIASPALGERLARSARENDARLAGLTRVFLGGGPVFPDIAAAWTRAAPNAVCHIAYGSSEAEPIAHRAAIGDDGEARGVAAQGGGLLVGQPTPETRLLVIADRWGEALGPMSEAELDDSAMPAGAPGEIVVAGDHVLPGYLGGEGDALTRIRVDGAIWFRTGDAGARDADGRLRVLGRCSERMASRGGAAYPLQIEAAARAHAPHAVTAALAVEGRILCLVQGADAALAARLHERLAPLGVDAVLPAARIPVDRRHGSKVDYVRARSIAAKLDEM